MSAKIQDRIILILDEWADVIYGPIQRGKWRDLEARTEVSAQKWKHVYGGNQKPTPEIIEATARYWPQYAFWMVTGITDSINGHIAPSTALTFPESQQSRSLIADISKTYFEYSIELSNKLFKIAMINLSSNEARLNLIKREYNYHIDECLIDYGDALLSKFIPELTKANEYHDLINYWKSRESLIKSKPSEVFFYGESSNGMASKSK